MKYRKCKNCSRCKRLGIPSKSKISKLFKGKYDVKSDRRSRKNKPRKDGLSIGLCITRSTQSPYLLVKNKKIGSNNGQHLKMECDGAAFVAGNETTDIPEAAPETASSVQESRQEYSINSNNTSTKYPDSSIATLSSYNSYVSIDQEPMV
ncbi:unnamed protein product [Leptidea sinapis]|uniref:Uncharacterized protein n=2 Tax=Leptidea sinapis TaxID=189913 RepID=A0A5E4R343_9NEOP|nr:unnamed protein product [Leptidea sinapis]